MEELEFTRNTYTSVFRSKIALLTRPRTRAIIVPSAHSFPPTSSFLFAFSRFTRYSCSRSRDHTRPDFDSSLAVSLLPASRRQPLLLSFPFRSYFSSSRMHASKQASKHARTHTRTHARTQAEDDSPENALVARRFSAQPRDDGVPACW